MTRVDANGVGGEHDHLAVSLNAWVDEWAQRPADQTAFEFEGHAVAYPELAARIDATARALAERGVGYGDRVAYCGFNRVELFELLFASARLGSIFCPLNHRLTPGELGELLADAEPAVVVGSDGFVPTLVEATAAAEIDVELIDLDHTLLVEAEQPHQSAVDEWAGADPAAPVLMVYTSGTTGRSKGAILTQDALHVTALNGIEGQGFVEDDVVLACLPNFHVGGLNIQVLPGLKVGATVVLERRFDPRRVLDLLAARSVSQTLLVPAMLTAVAALPDFGEIDLPCLDGVMSGSSLVPMSATRPWAERGIPVGQVYGATETGPTAAVLHPADALAHPDSCGLPGPHSEIRIVPTPHGADDEGVDCGYEADGEGDREGDGTPGHDRTTPHTAGEIWVRGRHLFAEYWRRPEATGEAFVDGWYRTGDVGYWGDDGYLYISDRIKDVVISGGENIYPAEVEAVLLEHPLITGIAVIGRPDERWGERAVAAVTLAPGERLTLEALNEWADGRLARYKRVRELVVVDDLPLTPLGKVQKNVLRHQLAALPQTSAT